MTSKPNLPPPLDNDADDDQGQWRHPPVAPRDEGPVESFGKAVSDVVTGPLDDASGKPQTRPERDPKP